MATVGRNNPCPCGSGVKFKRCCGDLTKVVHRVPPVSLDPRTFAAMRRRVEAELLQRQRQQGHGRPIISTELNGTRFVAVGNTVYSSNQWETFHDFLVHYLWGKVGVSWFQAEQAKPAGQQHPIAAWLHAAGEQAKAANRQRVNGKPLHSLSTGAHSALLNLANDLYSLEHNAEVQEKLLKRLRDAHNFFGARFELTVASALIRTGFTIELEDEDDRSQSHCEFVATYVQTGRKFSVEAKRRHGNKPGLGKQLVAALKKKADHTRIVFIDANLPDRGPPGVLAPALETSFKNLSKFEGREINGEVLPPAYVMVMNYPWAHHLSDTDYRCSFCFDGFKMPGFTYRGQPVTLRQAIDQREQHKEMHALLEELVRYGTVPATFNGEIPEYAFGVIDGQRLVVGDLYTLPQEDGSAIDGVLMDAVVSEGDRTAYCTFSLETGQQVVISAPLSAEELFAWKNNQETFFGVVRDKSEARTPLELYDFFLKGYRETSRERLLELMAGAPDIDALKELSREQLLSKYAERNTLVVLQMSQRQKDNTSND